MSNPDALVKFAVHEIVTNINNGLEPQAAAIKVAKELDLNHNFIKRSAEAVNVALHHNHFKKHPEAKADDFPLIDAAKVAEEIYNKNEKTASEYRSELFSSFQTPETTPKFSRYLEEGPHKEAYAKLASVTVKAKNDVSEAGVYEKSANYIRDLKKTAETNEAAYLESQYQTNSSFCNILTKLAKAEGYRTDWHEFESQVFSKHGEVAVPYLDLLYKAAATKEERGKHDKNYTMFTQCKEAEMFEQFLAKVDAMKMAKEASDTSTETLKFEQDYIKEAFVKRGCELLNIEKVADDHTLLERLEASLKREGEKNAQISEEDPVVAAMKTKKAAAIEKSASHVKAAIDYVDTAVDQAKGQLSSDPKLTATTNSPDDNRERAFMLQELATTDPILSKMPTHNVVNSYQQLLRIAPEISKEKELTRAFLRQAGASQAIDPFQGQQLIQADNSLLKNRQLEKGIKPSFDDKQH